MSSSESAETGWSERTRCLHVYLADHFDQFVRERTCLNNVTPKTRAWYQTAWSAFQRSQADAPVRQTTDPLLTRGDMQHFVLHLRRRGVKPISCNWWVRAMNAFARCLHEQGHIPELVRLAPQKVEKRLLAIHTVAAGRAARKVIHSPLGK